MHSISMKENFYDEINKKLFVQQRMNILYVGTFIERLLFLEKKIGKMSK